MSHQPHSSASRLACRTIRLSTPKRGTHHTLVANKPSTPFSADGKKPRYRAWYTRGIVGFVVLFFIVAGVMFFLS